MAFSSKVQPSSKPQAPLRTLFPPIELEEHPSDEPPRLKAVVVGTGISRINAGIVPVKVPGLKLKIHEKTSDIGGMWNTNIYPGVKCDVPADVYQSMFLPSLDWTTPYAAGAEIKAYWESIVRKYDVRTRGKWIINVTTNGVQKIEETDFFIPATGHFGNPLLPNYPELEDFEGHLRYSSNWDPEFDPILPPLQKEAKHLDHYARNSTKIAGFFRGEDKAGLLDKERPSEARNPDDYHMFRKALEGRFFSLFGGILKNEVKIQTLRKSFEKLMAERMGGQRSDLLNVPDFSPSCRRLTPGPRYLQALTQENVEYINTHIARFAKMDIEMMDHLHRKINAIICGTEADISFLTPFPIIHNKIDLQSAWRPGGIPGSPDTYLGIAALNFPNLFLVLGPNGSGQLSTVSHSVENQITYTAKVLRKVKSQGIRSIAPTQEATNDFRA